MMNKKYLILGLTTFLTGATFVSNASYVRMICLKSARSGQDQKLYGRYHTSYATADDHHCYFAFDPTDIEWISVAEARRRWDELKNIPWLPSYQGRLIFFTKNADSYQKIIQALKQSGVTLKHLNSILGEVPVAKNWIEIKTGMGLLPGAPEIRY